MLDRFTRALAPCDDEGNRSILASDLTGEHMEPRDYGPFPYTPINRRPTLKWPNNARVALWVIPNIEFFPLQQALPGHPFEKASGDGPTVRAWGQRDYGNRIG